MKLRSMPLLVATILTLAIGGGAGAATMHRFDIAETSGSAGALTILQTTPSGGAIQGQVGSTADTKQTIPFGVYGAYSGTQFGMGVVGISQTGYGVAAETFGSGQPAMIAIDDGRGDGLDTVSGESFAALSVNSGVGVYGYTYVGNGYGGEFGGCPQCGYGVVASADSGGSFSGIHGDGLDAESDDGDGFTAGTNGGMDGRHGGSGVVGGVEGQGIIAYGKSGTTTPALEADDTVGGSDLIGAFSFNSAEQYEPSESFIVQSNTANASGHTTGVGRASDVQISGDLYLSGNVYQSCNTFPETKSADCGEATASSIRAADGSDVRMYAPSQSAPTVEDLGVGHLSGGRIHVTIDAAFARTMSREGPYHVFLTPDGPNRGVYVTNRSSTGFDIAENPGGNSTVDVEYRIVATPFRNRGARLATLPPVRKPVLAAELLAARSFVKVKEAQAATFARGRRVQATAAERRGKMAQIQSTMTYPR